MAQQLQNYLRSYRRRTGFSQREIAFLLGCKAGSKVSRYEESARRPTVESLLAYEVIFGVPARHLFTGIFRKVEITTITRAQALARKIGTATRDRASARKLEELKRIASGPVPGPRTKHGI